MVRIGDMVYLPDKVGVVGVIGGLGLLRSDLLGYPLRGIGIWTTCWILLALESLVCLLWMHLVIRRLMREQAGDLVRHIESAPS